MSRPEPASSLRQALASAPRTGVGRAYPSDLRLRAIAHIARRRDEGVSDTAIADELGIHAMTFRRWVGARRGAFAETSIIPSSSTHEASSSAVIVHGPRGLRIEGLALEDVIALWTRLA